MKVYRFFTLCACLFAASCATDDVILEDDGRTDSRHAIPDAAFAEYLQFRGVGNVQLADGEYSLSSLAAASFAGKLDLRKNSNSITPLENAGIASAATKLTNLEGIQYFVNVDTLLLVSNELTALDVSALTRLKQLDINANFITSLDLSGNEELRYLRFGASARATELLTSIDLSANVNLEHLDLSGHGLTTIDLSANVNLKEIDLSGNPGAPFAIPAAIYDQLTTKTGVKSDAEPPAPPTPENTTVEIADVAFAEYLQFLQAGDVQLVNGKYLLDTVAANAFTGTLDLRKNAARITALEGASVASANDKITNLDGIQYFINVETLQLTSNELTAIDLSALAKLAYLDLNNNFIPSLDLSANTKLTYLSFNASSKSGVVKMTSIDLSANVLLEELSMTNHGLTTIDLSANTALKKVTLTGNPGAPFTIPAAIYDQLTTKAGVQK
ncbi:MAG: hypothetical protein LBI96_05785 [Odoribacteraceae bacterium]|jgi:hypothetical protein|nr:hypothetical protein [Odoribacteraceae bacterium]